MNMETKLFLRGWCRHPIPLASVSMNKVRSDDDDIDDYNDAVNVWCQVLIDGGGAGGPFWRILVEYLILVLVEYLKISDLGKFQIFCVYNILHVVPNAFSYISLTQQKLMWRRRLPLMCMNTAHVFL